MNHSNRVNHLNTSSPRSTEVVMLESRAAESSTAPAVAGRAPAESASSQPPSAFLAAVEQRIATALAAPFEARAARLVAGAGTRLALAGGAKRARPLLVETLAQLARLPRSTVVDFAAAVELVHTASLLHDDVVDAADTRRGDATANALWGNPVAVLAGDLVLTRALAVLRPHGLAVVGKAIDIVDEMTRAVAIEVLGRGDADFTLAQWRTMAVGKTGALFGFGAWLVAGQPERAARFERALRHLGVAFQIADDLADLTTDPQKNREGGLQDLGARNPSFAVMWGLDHAAPALREALRAFWADAQAPREAAVMLARDLVAAGVIAAGSEAAREEIRAAREALAPELGSAAVKQVLGWAEALVRLPSARRA
ncbi:MAG: polyprenyl synthetase family protein [Deltaproteobacteria bacterium]|nr:polyprenyl synthetase family protein [Deltaproteobacteria bacterium]